MEAFCCGWWWWWWCWDGEAEKSTGFCRARLRAAWGEFCRAVREAWFFMRLWARLGLLDCRAEKAFFKFSVSAMNCFHSLEDSGYVWAFEAR